MRDNDQLVGILEEEVSGYAELLDLLRKEKEAIISFNPVAIEEMAKRKDALLLKLRILDEERRRLLDERFKNSHEEPDLMTLYRETKDDRLPDLRGRLRSLLEGVQELNELNRIMIDRATVHVRMSSRFFQTFGVGETSPDTYSRQV
ncbi:MAG: flagellar protein FlgN [Nitrospirae bacterium]|nr:MAG: flagellar protein FlgN [Nitrospirota bacterium]